MKKINENTKVTLTFGQLKKLVKEGRGVQFFNKDEIRDWMLNNEEKVVELMAGDAMGATTWDEFVAACYDGLPQPKSNKSYEEFVNDFYREGTCWDEFEGGNLDDLADMLVEFGDYWM